MLTEEQINILPERIAQRLQQITTEYLETTGRVIKTIGELRPTDVHRLQKMYDYGADMHRISLKLAEASRKNVEDIYDMFDVVAQENYRYSRPFYEAKGITFVPYEENESLQKYVRSIAKQTAGEYINLTQHSAFAIFDKSGKDIAPLFASGKNKVATSLSDTYTRVIDLAVTKVQLGEESYQSAMRDVMRAMVNSGIKTVDYATGYSKRLESAVRQNVLWGVKQCNQNVADLVGQDFGADGYEISYHSNPRPSHADMAGEQFAIGEGRVVDGVYYPSFEEHAKPLLEEYGCLHFKFSILLGVSSPTYSNEQLEKLKASDGQKIAFEGKEYTRYEARQLMGQIENSIRKHKDLANMAKEAGNEEFRREIQSRIDGLTKKYAQLSIDSELDTRMERLHVSGFKRTKGESSPEGFATYKAIVNRKKDKEQYRRYAEILGADNLPATFDLFQEIKYNNPESWEDIKYYVRNIGSRPVECVKIDRELRKLGLKPGKAIPYVHNKAYILEDKRSKDPAHIMKRMQERNITSDEIQGYVNKAVIVFEQYKGQRLAYYSDFGVAVLTKTDDYPRVEWIAKTAWTKHDFTEEALQILEVAKKHAQ